MDLAQAWEMGLVVMVVMVTISPFHILCVMFVVQVQPLRHAFIRSAVAAMPPISQCLIIHLHPQIYSIGIQVPSQKVLGDTIM